jgi:polyhydroxybutyrate depolymerase
MAYGNHTRTYILHRPDNLPASTPAPLVIVMHGGFGTAAQAERSYGWDELADRQGFVVAYPNGINRAWNSGGICCGTPYKENVDDVGFLSALIGELTRTENIDPSRVYMSGISNGAAMAYRYACSNTEPAVAAIGSVSGSFSFACPQARPTSVVEIHGLEDHNIPMDGGKGTRGVSGVSWVPVQQTIDLFRSADSCSAPNVQQRGQGVTVYDSACAGGRDVTLITIAGAGHQWPGGPHIAMGMVMIGFDQNSTALNATQTLWNFFSTHPLRGG